MPEAATHDLGIPALVCSDCGRLDPGPREICPNCHSCNLEPKEVNGTGQLLSWTVIRRPPAPFRGQAPYAVAVVDLDAGVRVTGRLRDQRDDLLPGARVRCVSLDDGIPTFAEVER